MPDEQPEARRQHEDHGEHEHDRGVQARGEAGLLLGGDRPPATLSGEAGRSQEPPDEGRQGKG